MGDRATDDREWFRHSSRSLPQHLNVGNAARRAVIALCIMGL
jgi:hypothetical protein